jgi:branched-chain amino acid transport system substrate-binding protein
MQKLLRSVTPLAAAALILAACQGGSSPSASQSGGVAPSGSQPGGTKGTIMIGVDLPLSGGEAPNGQPTLSGVRLLVDQTNAKGGVAGYTVDTDVRDDAVNGVHNPEQGATNAQALVGNENVIGMVGPFNSNVGAAEIPVTAQAGLLQCSPANTNPGLTKPDASGKFLRGDNPVSYVRVAATDDLQGPGLADYLYNTLGKKSVFIVDDTETYGKGLADTFEAKFKELGGTVTGRQGVANPDGSADYTSILTNAKGQNPEAVMYGGVTTTGGAKLRTQMASTGMGDLPFIGGDGIVDGDGNSQGSFVNLAKQDAANSYGSVAAIHDIPNAGEFTDAFKAKYGSDPGAYSAPAYACAQVILQAVEAVAADASDMKDLRAKVRAYVADPSHSFDTVLGKISFDENGDSSQKIISFYKTDMSAADGVGDWVFDKQQDFASK